MKRLRDFFVARSPQPDAKDTDVSAPSAATAQDSSPLIGAKAHLSDALKAFSTRCISRP